MVLETRSPKSRCGEGHAPTDGSRRESFFASFSLGCLSAILAVPGLKDTSWLSRGHLLSVSSHCLLCIYPCPNFPFLYRYQSHQIGPTLMISFSLYRLFPNKGEILGMRTPTYLFRGQESFLGFRAAGTSLGRTPMMPHVSL